MIAPRQLVSPRHIVSILGAIIGIRIASAFAILLLWLPVVRAEPTLFQDPALLFPFIAQREAQWRGAFFAGVLTSALAVPLCVLLSRYFTRSTATDESFLFIGVGGFVIDVVATVMSMLGTLWLADHYAEYTDVAFFVYQWAEAWRDEGLKTISFLAIGIYTLHIAYVMRGAPKSLLMRATTWLFGFFMLLIGVLDAFGLFEIGEYGIASGFGHIFYAAWGLSVGYWFWFCAPPRETFQLAVDAEDQLLDANRKP
jgi:hypothetical protein